MCIIFSLRNVLFILYTGTKNQRDYIFVLQTEVYNESIQFIVYIKWAIVILGMI